MTPELANAVDPIFLHVLHLLESISSGREHEPIEERTRISGLLAKAEAMIGTSREWMLAKYAIISWIDEVLVDTHWNGKEWWSNNVLEMEIFNTRSCYEMFFVHAKEASSLADRDAMEIYYICVMLGFRGLYEDPELAASIIQSNDFPPTLDRWTQQAALSIQSGFGRPAIDGRKRELRGAPLRTGFGRAVWPWFGAMAVGVVATLYYLVNWHDWNY